MNRREFLRFALASSVVASATTPLFAATQPDFWSRPRSLWLIRGKEQVREVYLANGRYNPAGYEKICHILRDVKANQHANMSIQLLDILRGIQGWFEINGIQKPLVIHSGFRTKQTNDATEGAKKNSMHLLGRAADLHVPDVPVDYLARLGLYLRGGGVGMYVGDRFIHVDDGDYRTWTQ